MANEVLRKSKEAKNDEFYTLYNDIANEVSLYAEQLRGKHIICPCDWDESYTETVVWENETSIAPSNLTDKGGSIKSVDIQKTKYNGNNIAPKCNFVKFLVAHAEDYNIASISVSGYNPKTGEGVKFQDVDFSKYDVVITNPPFSVFREFIETITKYKIKFLIIGNKNAITYKETFKLIKEDKMWLGYRNINADMWFIVPDNYEYEKIMDGKHVKHIMACWFTNLDTKKRHEEMILCYKYDPQKYPKYDNYNAINVDKVTEIPFDYYDTMGVPITFLDKYNPAQFEIIGMSSSAGYNREIVGLENDTNYKDARPLINNKNTYARIFIKRKEASKRTQN